MAPTKKSQQVTKKPVAKKEQKAVKQPNENAPEIKGKSTRTTQKEKPLKGPKDVATAKTLADIIKKDSPPIPPAITPITAVSPEVVSATIETPVKQETVSEVNDVTKEVPVNFENEIPPVVTKLEDVQDAANQAVLTPQQKEQLATLKKHMAPIINFLENFKQTKVCHKQTIDVFLKENSGHGLEYTFDAVNNLVIGTYFGTVTHSIRFIPTPTETKK